MNTRPLNPARDEPAPDVEVAGYRLVGKPRRREGGSLLFEARSARGEPAALQLSAEPVTGRRSRARFRRLARARAGVSHPSLLPVLDVGDHGGRPYVVSPPVPPRSLADLLRDGPLAADVAVQWLAATAEGLDAANDAGLVHLTLGPESLLLDRSELLLDLFGIFSVTGQASWGDVVRRDPHLRYESPEAVRGEELDRRSNVYSVAAILVHAVTGREPFPEQDPMLIEYAHVSQPPPRPSQRDPRLPKAFDELIARAMAKDPAHRPASAGALLAETARVLEVRPIAAPVVAPAPVDAPAPVERAEPPEAQAEPAPAPPAPPPSVEKEAPPDPLRPRAVLDAWLAADSAPTRPVVPQSPPVAAPRPAAVAEPAPYKAPLRRRVRPYLPLLAALVLGVAFGMLLGMPEATPEPPRPAPPADLRVADRLDEVRLRLRDELAQAATPEEQGAVAGRLASAHTTAAGRLDSPELQTAAGDLATAYAALAEAAENGDADAFEQAAQDVETGERELAAARVAPDGR
jgi:Protein kinase domain